MGQSEFNTLPVQSTPNDNAAPADKSAQAANASQTQFMKHEANIQTPANPK